MKKWLHKNTLIIIGSIVGGTAGYIYFKQVGCSNGTCMISSNPYISTIYFAVLGGFLFNMFKPKVIEATTK
jgi:hypothetical protein